MPAESSPKIVIVDESPVRAAILEAGLREAGFTGVSHIGEMQNLLARIYELDPDVILIDLENPSRDVLEQMFQVSRAVRRPIATLTRAMPPRFRPRSMPGFPPISSMG